MSSIGAIVADKEVFLRERAAALYNTEPYFASKILCDLLPLRMLVGTRKHRMPTTQHQQHISFMMVLMTMFLPHCTATGALWLDCLPSVRSTSGQVRSLPRGHPAAKCHSCGHVLFCSGVVELSRHCQSVGILVFYLQYCVRGAAADRGVRPGCVGNAAVLLLSYV